MLRREKRVYESDYKKNTRHVALKKGFENIGNYDGLDVFIRRTTI